MTTQLGAMQCAVAGLFDYAGMFPPAELDLHAAMRAYEEYRLGEYAWALRCLVVDTKALSMLRGNDVRDLRLSVTATDASLDVIQQCLADDLQIKMVELKTGDEDAIAHLKKCLPASVAAYVEIPIGMESSRLLDAIVEAGVHAKLRMGGVVDAAFPASAQVAATLKMLAERRIAFKATAGLHHPLRSRHPFTYQQDSRTGLMHGFINLLCAAALVWFGGDANEATELLEEQDATAWRVAEDVIEWRAQRWSLEQLRETRERFLMSIGSCSFTEPIHDLEALGWF